MPQAGFGKDGFRLYFADGVVIVDTDVDGVPGTAPVDGRRSVAGFGHCADVHYLHGIRVRLRLNGADNVPGRRDVCFLGLHGIVVCRWRDHTAHVQHIVRARHQIQHILVAGQVTPYKADGRIIEVFLEFFAVFLAVSQQKDDAKEIFLCVKFQETLVSHGSGSACQSNSLFVQANHPFFADKKL